MVEPALPVAAMTISTPRRQNPISRTSTTPRGSTTVPTGTRTTAVSPSGRSGLEPTDRPNIPFQRQEDVMATTKL